MSADICGDGASPVGGSSSSGEWETTWQQDAISLPMTLEAVSARSPLDVGEKVQLNLSLLPFKTLNENLVVGRANA